MKWPVAWKVKKPKREGKGKPAAKAKVPSRSVATCWKSLSFSEFSAGSATQAEREASQRRGLEG